LLVNEEVGLLPDYVLTAYAKTLRNLKRWQDAIQAYDALVLRDDNNIDAKLGAVMALADASDEGGTERGMSRLNEIERAELGDEQLVQYYLACGYLNERSRKYIRALDCYNQGLRREPERRELKLRRLVIASALGATQFSLDEIRRNPDLLTDEEAVQVELNASAMKIRWANLREPNQRGETLSSVIESQETIETQTVYQARIAAFDSIVAHVSLFQMEQALRKAKDLQNDEFTRADFPAYVLDALGHAHLYQEEPREAIACFKQALGSLPEKGAEALRFKLSVGLFYALSDAQEFVEVAQLAETLRASEIPWRQPKERLWVRNNRFTDSEHVSALALAYREKYQNALLALDAMLAIAPANDSLRLSRAAIARWRGWYEQSRHHLELVQDRNAQGPVEVQRTHLGLDTQDYQAAERSLGIAQDWLPEDKSVQAISKRWRNYQRGVMEVSATSGRADGGELGNRYLEIRSSYFTAPINYHFRGYLNENYRFAEFREGEGRDHHLGAGVEYRDRGWTIRGGVHAGFEQASGVGLDANLAWQVDDHWRHELNVASKTRDMPLRGARQGIDADLLRINSSYRWHEGRSASASLGAMDFSDGNQRSWLDLGYRHRVGNWPRQKLTLLGGLYSSRNSDDQVPYFSPKNDRDIGFDIEHEWRIWARYDEAFVQRIRVGLGNYYQDRFGGDQRWRLALEHEWRLFDGFNLSYGFTFGRRPYDGVQEKQKAVFLTLRALL
jgi:biofilm PGA synthesis protein PgaA